MHEPNFHRPLPNVAALVPPPPHPAFAGVEPEVVTRILSQAHLERISAGQQLFGEDEPAQAVFLLQRGTINLCCAHPDGPELALRIMSAPSILGAAECLLKKPYHCSAVAMETATALRIPRHVFVQAVGSSMPLARNMLRDLSAQLCHADRRHRHTAFASAREQVAQALTSLTNTFGLPVREGRQIRLPMNQDVLSDLLGVTRRSITRALKPWLDDGLVQKKGRQFFVIKDLARIAEVAATHTASLVFRSGNGGPPAAVKNSPSRRVRARAGR